MANKTIYGRKCTIMWLVDKLKITHVDKKVMEDVIMQLNNKFGKESPRSLACLCMIQQRTFSPPNSKVTISIKADKTRQDKTYKWQ